MSADPYYQRPEWSYSSMKVIIDSGIDYAVAAKRGDLGDPDSAAIDLGQLVHQSILGGGDTFVIMKYPDLRSKEARDWVDEQKANGKIVVSLEIYDIAQKMIANIKAHPHTPTYLINPAAKHEQELFATASGVKLRGKADAILHLNLDDQGIAQQLIITDIKTTAFFDKFEKDAIYKHYDLQAANYTLIGASALKIDLHDEELYEKVKYYFCVAESVAPFRVGYYYASPEFVESGERKLGRAIEAINDFGDNQPNFLIEEIKTLGDWSTL